MNQDKWKRAAAEAAVGQELRSGMRVGLGSGSTMRFALEAIGEALRLGQVTDIVGVPTSDAVAEVAREQGIPLIDLHEAGELDLALDGADEVDPTLDLIKGLGGAMLREKMIAQHTQRLVIVADESKLVPFLGAKSALPVEVVRFGWRSHLPLLHELGARAVRREQAGQPFLTDNGNYVLDCHFDHEKGIEDPAVLEWLLLAHAGIVDHGLFLDMAAAAYIAGTEGVTVMARAPKEGDEGEGVRG